LPVNNSGALKSAGYTQLPVHLHAYTYVSIRQHTLAYFLRQHTSAYVRIRQHTLGKLQDTRSCLHTCTHAYQQHTSAYVSIRQHTSAYVSTRPHTSAYVSILQHTSAYALKSAGHTVLPAHVRAALLYMSDYSGMSSTMRSYCILQSAYVSIRQHTSAYVSIRQHT
jgi:hypothetical protein